MGENRRFRLALILKLTMIAAALAVISHADSGKTFAATVTVNVGDNWFCNSSFSVNPCPTSINAGDTITWDWVGFNPHTSTACSNATYSTCGAAQGWDSGTMSFGGTFSKTFNNGGTFYYRCQIHTSMRGRIEVVIQDSDNDAWSDAAETTIGTDPLDGCADNTADDAHPADFNNDTFFDISDIGAVAASFGEPVATATARKDIAPDLPDGFVDIADIGAVAGRFGTGCGP